MWQEVYAHGCIVGVGEIEVSKGGGGGGEGEGGRGKGREGKGRGAMRGDCTEYTTVMEKGGARAWRSAVRCSVQCGGRGYSLQ